MTKLPIQNDVNLIAACGLYCGGCGRLLAGKCPGCAETKKADWCKVRSCCREHNYATCAQCAQESDPANCKKLVNFISGIFSLIFKSDRPAAIRYIKTNGSEAYAALMSSRGTHCIKRGESCK